MADYEWGGPYWSHPPLVFQRDDGRVTLDLGCYGHNGDGRSRISRVSLAHEEVDALVVRLCASYSHEQLLALMGQLIQAAKEAENDTE